MIGQLIITISGMRGIVGENLNSAVAPSTVALLARF